ncbi:sensor histidine kinase [Halomonas halocynthiae]|uniref:sensor histidine kinase n=1 Tax=Halomonas halocynthiae TaxID=176290 RepID=UPI00041802BC|nr:sensor histidine kinase [Halomonas halocynthiae]
MSVANSLYARLLGWLLLLLLGLGGIMVQQAWLDAKLTADRAYDRLLEAATLAIAEQVKWQDDRLWLDLPPAALEMLSTDAEERVFYSLHDANGRFVTGNIELPALGTENSHSSPGNDIFTVDNMHYRDLPLRLGTRYARIDVWQTSAGFEVRMAHTREGRQQLTNQLFRRSLSYILGMAALSVSIFLVAIRLALAPLTRLRRALRERDPRTLEPLTLPLPRELAELREALNELLKRMRRVHAGQERFIGDASHQLRTPLAGLSARAELALRHQDPEQWRDALKAMLDTSTHASRQAMQLLSLTRLNNPEYRPELKPLNLAHLAQDAVTRHWSTCHRAGIDLGLNAPSAETNTTPPVIFGEQWQLEEALSNLIDNAQRHGARHITLSTTMEPLGILVDDDGPGIPTALRTRVLRPFHRISHDPEGSGLGLAIVNSIARAHHAQFILSDSPTGGLRAALYFPASQPNLSIAENTPCAT